MLLYTILPSSIPIPINTPAHYCPHCNDHYFSSPYATQQRWSTPTPPDNQLPSIPRNTNKKDTSLYTTLHLPPTATPAEIKDAYHRLALVYHPDKNRHHHSHTHVHHNDPDPHPDQNPDKVQDDQHTAAAAAAAAEKFKTISAAYAILSDLKRREVYDRCGLWAAEHMGEVERTGEGDGEGVGSVGEVGQREPYGNGSGNRADGGGGSVGVWSFTDTHVPHLTHSFAAPTPAGIFSRLGGRRVAAVIRGLGFDDRRGGDNGVSWIYGGAGVRGDLGCRYWSGAHEPPGPGMVGGQYAYYPYYHERYGYGYGHTQQPPNSINGGVAGYINDTLQDRFQRPGLNGGSYGGAIRGGGVYGGLFGRRKRRREGDVGGGGGYVGSLRVSHGREYGDGYAYGDGYGGY